MRKAGILAALMVISASAHAAQPGQRPVPSTAAGIVPASTANYVVIGSFQRRANAERWARYNDEFGTAVQALENSGQTVYRVVVGPLDSDSAPMMLEILKAVGLHTSWPLAACSGPSTGATCSGLDDAHSARIAER